MQPGAINQRRVSSRELMIPGTPRPCGTLGHRCVYRVNSAEIRRREIRASLFLAGASWRASAGGFVCVVFPTRAAPLLATENL